MKKLYTPNGDEIIGVLERVYGTALASGFDEENAPIYSGQTDLVWDTQEPVLDPDSDEYIYRDSEGGEFSLSDLTIIEE